MTPARKNTTPLPSVVQNLYPLSGWKIFATHRLQGLTPFFVRQMIQCAAHMSLCSLGNLSKPGALLHYLQVPFGTTLNLQGTLNKQQWRLQSMQSNLGTTICDLLDQELSTPRPSLSINFCNPWRLPAPPAAGTQVQSAGHLCSSFDLGSELTWGSGTQCCSGHCTLKRKNKQTKKNYPEEKARTRGA